MSTILIAGTAVALLVLTRGWLGEREWPRTPTIVWNLLLLPVGWSFAQAGRSVLGWSVIGVALVATFLAFITRPDTVPADRGPDETDADG